jgi:hypothetical protein
MSTSRISEFVSELGKHKQCVLVHRNSSLGVSPSELAGEELASVGADWPDVLEHSFNMGDVLTTGYIYRSSDDSQQ